MTTFAGFTFNSACGRVFYVPWDKVKEDYEDALMDMDGLSREEVRKNITPDDVTSWAYEQLDWDDVDRLGYCVKEASAADIRRALKKLRASSEADAVGTDTALAKPRKAKK